MTGFDDPTVSSLELSDCGLVQMIGLRLRYRCFDVEQQRLHLAGPFLLILLIAVLGQELIVGRMHGKCFQTIAIFNEVLCFLGKSRGIARAVVWNKF